MSAGSGSPSRAKKQRTRGMSLPLFTSIPSFSVQPMRRRGIFFLKTKGGAPVRERPALLDRWIYTVPSHRRMTAAWALVMTAPELKASFSSSTPAPRAHSMAAWAHWLTWELPEVLPFPALTS